MKLIDADKGYEVLDQIFAAIQKNNYAADQQMLDEAWKKWCDIPAAYDMDRVAERLEVNSMYVQEEMEPFVMLDDAVQVVKTGGIG